MQRLIIYLSLISITIFASCNADKTKKQHVTQTLSAREVVHLNQLVYKDTIRETFSKFAPGYDLVYLPRAVNGNYAVIAKNKTTEQYALIIRGSLIEFSNTGFQNFILQDFNIFTIKPWNYADTIKEAYISEGAFTGLQNLLQLRDIATGLSLKEFVETSIPGGASIVISGHSLGGNLAYPLAGYLKKELSAEKKYQLQLITFGAPAAGNAAFVQDLEEKFPAAERYVIDKDIAPAFPNIDRINEIAKRIGLDSVLQISQQLNAGDLLNIAGKILEATNVINKTNKYVQSGKDLRLLTSTDSIYSDTALSVDAIFNKAYRFHKIDTYAELLGGKSLK